MAFQDNSYRSENTSDECSTLMPTTATTTISRQPPKMVQRRYFILVLFTLASGLFLFKSWTQFGSTDVKLVRFDRTAESTTNRIYSHHHNNNNDNSQHSSLLLPMPSGVNFGSWLSLEDYFFAGSGAAVEVSTHFGSTQGACLPPLHVGPPGPRWQSETDLLRMLTEQTGGSLAKALAVIHAHRVSFIDWNNDLSTLRDLGIQHVRVPMSWCLTSASYTTMDPHASEHALRQNYTCKDPFFDGVYWPAVPKSFVEDFLRACARHGIRATLDIHTGPGATSIGTFSGVWPSWPRFWINDDPKHPRDDLGRSLFSDFVQWIESFDKETLAGLRAISPMNEPAHLAGLFGRNDSKAYLPDLPVDLAESFLSKLNGNNNNKFVVPDGPHLRVFLWLSDAVETFRASTLPSLGVEIHVNIHESLLRADTICPNCLTDEEKQDSSTRTIAAWWRGITTRRERHSWAVLDMHHYVAWSEGCQGAVDGPPSGNYTCGDNPERAATFARCMTWANVYRSVMDDELGKGAKLVSGEFSASTHHLVRHACNDLDTLRAFYLGQVRVAEKADVELYWWSFKMPYGGAFRPAWSFKHFMYLMGVLAHPDESTFACGEHVLRNDDPHDDFFYHTPFDNITRIVEN
jgi:hypothetical protein